MSDNIARLRETIKAIQRALALPQKPGDDVLKLLQSAKSILLRLKLLVPDQSPGSAGSDPDVLYSARYVFELGATVAIRLHDFKLFTRYFHQLQPFYALPPDPINQANSAAQHHLTGLYMVLLLTQRDYAGFHSLLEHLEVQSQAAGSDLSEIYRDPCINYPIQLQQALMEGSYNKVYEMIRDEPGKILKITSGFGDLSKVSFC